MRAREAVAAAAGRCRWLPLTVILVVQAVLALRLTWSNTAFEDEGTYLWAGRLELSALVHGTVIQGSFPEYFSGAPVLYPPLGAVASALGGLAGARLLSLAFLLGTTALLYLTTARLFDRAAALGAALVFVLLSSTQFLSAYATYDAMALFLLALSAWLVIRSSAVVNHDYGESLLALAGLVLALADAVKYATALWDPVVIALAALLAPVPGWKKAVLRAVRLTIYTAMATGLALLAGGSSYVTGILATTVTRSVSSSQATPAATVLRESLTWTWPVIILAAAAVAISFTRPGTQRWLCGLLALAVVLSPLHQVQIGTDISLNKHVDFGAWFGAAAAGYALARVSRVRWPSGPAGAAAVLATAGVLALAAWSGITLSTSFLTNGWPNMASAVTRVESLLPAHPCPCLMLSSEVMDYYLNSVIPVGKEQNLLTTPYYFEYTVPGTQDTLTGTAAYVAAVKNHYFSIVEDDFYDEPQLSQAVDQAVAQTPGYHLVDTTTWEGTVESHVWYYQPPFFDDEFTGAAGAAPDPAQWHYDTGSAASGQLETYTSARANSYLDGAGHLVIAVTKHGAAYQSARLTTAAAFTRGDTFQARIKLDVQPGTWPAWWLLGAGDRQEVDMLENYGGPTSQTTVWNAANGRMSSKDVNFPARPGWHTYEVQWTSGGLHFSLDGREYLAVTPDEFKDWGYSGNVALDMILNVAVGGIAKTPPGSVKFPVTMAVDWVRVWK